MHADDRLMSRMLRSQSSGSVQDMFNREYQHHPMFAGTKIEGDGYTTAKAPSTTMAGKADDRSTASVWAEVGGHKAEKATGAIAIARACVCLRSPCICGAITDQQRALLGMSVTCVGAKGAGGRVLGGCTVVNSAARNSRLRHDGCWKEECRAPDSRRKAEITTYAERFHEAWSGPD